MKRIDVHRLADEARFNGFHTRVLFWGLLILIFDGYDLAVVGAALPSIMKDMGVSAGSAGFMASSALFGMMFGAIVFGTLADKIGRILTVSICVALFSAFTALAGLTRDPISFSVMRFLAGLGIGGVLPVVTAQMAEFSPLKIRARLVVLVFMGYSLGGILVALTGKQLIGAYGWQSVFFAAGLPLLLIPFILKTMPESMPFLIKKKRDEELRQIVRRLAPDQALRGDEQFLVPAEDKATEAPIKRLFQDGRAFSTVMIWIAFLTGLFMVYALSSWLTKLMAMAGYSLGSALTFTLLYNVGAIVGSVLGAWLGDKFNIKYVLVVFYALGAVSLTLMGFTKSTELLYVVIFVVGASTLGTQVLAYAYAGEFYPAAVRSTGVGFAGGVGRLGAILGPILIGGLVALQLPLEQNFMAIAVAGLIGAVAVMMINHKLSASTHHLDAMSETASAKADTAAPA
ncbi:MFS transporter [Variovorax sp. WS11]|uniref:MFS transporter n=1 Tax=Variovorax sp. WS11 TaxID=1105204 RepID=UPI000D0D040F|nr:aromatic acid/H+ symport family MFS transporter [Variovorax sp. WS11]NDZ18951.1 aromatic acid/H+ symport family MFS transporter [Variovorax sp. WS11]PSL82457.1 MFS transporter [Variovorax sp. WS11]